MMNFVVIFFLLVKQITKDIQLYILPCLCPYTYIPTSYLIDSRASEWECTLYFNNFPFPLCWHQVYQGHLLRPAVVCREFMYLIRFFYWSTCFPSSNQRFKITCMRVSEDLPMIQSAHAEKGKQRKIQKQTHTRKGD